MRTKLIITGMLLLAIAASIFLMQQVSLNRRYTLYLSSHSVDTLMQKLVDLTGVYVSYKKALRIVESKPDESLRSIELWGKQTLPLFNITRDNGMLVFTGMGQQKDVLCLLFKLIGTPFRFVDSFSLAGLKHNNISFKIIVRGGAGS